MPLAAILAPVVICTLVAVAIVVGIICVIQRRKRTIEVESAIYGEYSQMNSTSVLVHCAVKSFASWHSHQLLSHA